MADALRQCRITQPQAQMFVRVSVHKINLIGLFWFRLVFWKFRHLSPGGSARAIFGLPDFFFWKRPPSKPLSRVRGGVFVYSRVRPPGYG